MVIPYWRTLYIALMIWIAAEIRGPVINPITAGLSDLLGAVVTHKIKLRPVGMAAALGANNDMMVTLFEENPKLPASIFALPEVIK